MRRQSPPPLAPMARCGLTPVAIRNVRALSDIATELVMAAVTKGSHGGCVLDGTPRTQEEAIKVLRRRRRHHHPLIWSDFI